MYRMQFSISLVGSPLRLKYEWLVILITVSLSVVAVYVMSRLLLLLNTYETVAVTFPGKLLSPSLDNIVSSSVESLGCLASYT